MKHSISVDIFQAQDSTLSDEAPVDLDNHKPTFKSLPTFNARRLSLFESPP